MPYDDAGLGDLAVFVVCLRNHRHFLDRRMRIDHRLQLLRVDIHAPADDQLFLAVDDEEESLVIDVPHIAGV